MLEMSGTFEPSMSASKLNWPKKRLYIETPIQSLKVSVYGSTENNRLMLVLVPVERVHADEENLLQAIGPGSQEAVVSCLSLHWVNDLPGMIAIAASCCVSQYLRSPNSNTGDS